MPETIDTYYPQNELLQQHVAYYYFLSTDGPDYHIHFHVYPQLQVPVTIHRFAEFAHTGKTAHVRGSTAQRHLTLCNGLLRGPLEASISGLQNRVTVVFQPLGINHFIEAPYNSLIGRSIQPFTGWDGQAYDAFLEAFFDGSTHREQLKLLEVFLLCRYRPLPRADVLRQAMALLTDFDDERSVAQVAAACAVSERTLSRLFQSWLSASPVQVRKIARFRRTMALRQAPGQSSLTDVAHRGSYYDQSHLIGDYHELTGMRPAYFFKTIRAAADGQVLMRVLE
ncbi:helix-turn-helix domain-containing protein [Flaviaesturariibacter amylovorans]|uniref:AraC family transcriptional regulator n=1 Tax=Flaviaesturariibacter amylovorans TaxID=1084520 RepID=A0ABP8GZI3_9BACT